MAWNNIKIGITPAYAGKRMIKPSVLDCIKDHPRLCGEKCADFCKAAICVGSPPPMRGKVASCPLVEENARITPAYAGKSTLLYFTLLL